MTTHKQILAQCKKLIPPLTKELHKGQAGRVGVLGGSKDYAGAPYFSSMTALRVGADLAHVICEPSAGLVIKTYSPDLIVHTDLTDDSTEESLTTLLNSLLPRLHTLVIGPGLGRSPSMQLAARTAITLARAQGLFIIIDADGLFLIQSDPSLVRGYSRVVLTPNVVEFGRLLKAVGIDPSEDPDQLAVLLSRALEGVTILEKGAVDRITNGDEVLLNEVRGSERRCGGQGDVLSGAVGTFLAWGKAYEEEYSHSEPIPSARIPLLAAYAASTITRHASHLTFARKKRGMQTSDMLEDIGHSFEQVFGDEVGKGERSELRWSGRWRSFDDCSGEEEGREVEGAVCEPESYSK